MEKQIINLLKQDYSFEEIQGKLHITNQDLYLFLSSINMDITNHYNHIKFYENGKRGYSNTLVTESGVVTYKNNDYYKAVIISDTHLGSTKENIGLINMVYDYCIQNDIHNIFHLGDLFDGTSGCIENKKLDPKDQISHVILDYPMDSSILNFILFGNHDLDIISEDYPLHEAIIKNRKDMCPLGYGTKDFYIKNDSIILKHSILIDKTDNNYNGKLIIKGHSHQMKFVNDLNNYLLYVPSLSDLQFVDGTIPGFLQVEYGFYNGYINECKITHYGINNNQLINMNTIRVNLKSHKKEKTIEREEAYVKIKK